MSVIKLPYFSQWESPELVTDILTKKIKASEDPKWAYSGAVTPEEYDFWSWNVCGMACLKSILTFVLGGTYGTITLAKECAVYGGYKVKKNEITGLFYDPFCKYVQTKFGLSASYFGNDLTLDRIKKETANGNFFIVSVNFSIRDSSNPEPLKKGGHLVLITGFDEKNGCFYIHNPSGFSFKSQEHYPISYNDFLKFFAARGILIVR